MLLFSGCSASPAPAWRQTVWAVLRCLHCISGFKSETAAACWPTIRQFSHSQCKFNNYKKMYYHLIHESLHRNVAFRHHLLLRFAQNMQFVVTNRRTVPGCKQDRAKSFGPQAAAFSHTLLLCEGGRQARHSASAFHGLPSFSLAQETIPAPGRCSPSCLIYSQRQPRQQPGLPLCLCLSQCRLGISIPSRSAPQPSQLDRGNCAVPVSSSSHVLPGQPQYPDL